MHSEYSAKRSGVAESLGLIDETDIIVGTFGKSLRLLRRLCIDFGDTARLSCERRARSLIFSTAIPPVCAAWSLMMTEILEDMSDERARLAEISAEFRGIIEDITGKECVSRSQIVPLMAGDATKAVKNVAPLLRRAGRDRPWPYGALLSRPEAKGSGSRSTQGCQTATFIKLPILSENYEG